jgi:hypothetical protein
MGRYHFGMCKNHRHSYLWRVNQEANKAKGRHVARKVSSKYSSLKASAKRMGRSVTITAEEFHKLNKLPCYYCKGPLPETGHGLDRLDNSNGYHPLNVVPCCGDCNRLRGDRLTPEETLVAVQAIQQYRLDETRRSIKIIKS